MRGPSARFVAVIYAMSACATGQRPGAPDQPVAGDETTASPGAGDVEVPAPDDPLATGELHVIYTAEWPSSSLRLDTRARTLEFAECFQGPWTFAVSLDDAHLDELRELLRAEVFFALPERSSRSPPGVVLSCTPPSDLEVEVSVGERRHRVRRECISGSSGFDFPRLLSWLQAIVEATLASASYEHKGCKVH